MREKKSNLDISVLYTIRYIYFLHSSRTVRFPLTFIDDEKVVGFFLFPRTAAYIYMP